MSNGFIVNNLLKSLIIATILLGFMELFGRNWETYL